MSANPYKTFGLSCPNGGDFHICENTKREFIGCCTVDPCADGSGLCEKSNLRAASFSESSYLDIPPQSCDSTGGDDHFYTCTANDPPFIGCCTVNPCVNMTCPSANLRAAVLSSDHDDRASFLAPSTSSSGGKSTAASASNGLSSGAISGIVIGIVAFLIFVVVIVLWRLPNWNPFKSTKPRNSDASSTKSANEALMDSPKTPWSGHTNSSAFSTLSPMSDPRSGTFPPISASPLPSYHKYQTAGHEYSPHGQWHTPQTTQPPPPIFHPQRDDSRTWPFQSPLYEPHHSPSPKMPQQNAWPGRQSVHELLAEVQSSRPELPAQERVQELRSSCVVQPLRPPPPLKGLAPDGVPDSPTLGPQVGADGANRKARAALEASSAHRSPVERQGAQEKCLTEATKPHQANGAHSKRDQAELSLDSTNFI